jgi:hypothetical protein
MRVDGDGKWFKSVFSCTKKFYYYISLAIVHFVHLTGYIWKLNIQYLYNTYPVYCICEQQVFGGQKYQWLKTIIIVMRGIPQPPPRVGRNSYKWQWYPHNQDWHHHLYTRVSPSLYMYAHRMYKTYQIFHLHIGKLIPNKDYRLCMYSQSVSRRGGGGTESMGKMTFITGKIYYLICLFMCVLVQETRIWRNEQASILKKNISKFYITYLMKIHLRAGIVFLMYGFAPDPFPNMTITNDWIQ